MRRIVNWQELIKAHMLDNISGPDAIPSQAFIKDLRVLCGLPREELKKLAEAFATLTGELNETDGAKLASALKALQADPEVLISAVNSAKYVWDSWARRRLTKEQVLTDFLSIGVSEEQLKNVVPLIDVMEGKLANTRRRQDETSAINIGTPAITSSSFAIDTRVVFKDRQFLEDAGDDQPYYQIDFLLPIVILEIVSELNDNTDTASFILDESGLDDMINILSRARRRLTLVKEHIAKEIDNGRENT